jgi:hypothetical protein
MPPGKEKEAVPGVMIPKGRQRENKKMKEFSVIRNGESSCIFEKRKHFLCPTIRMSENKYGLIEEILPYLKI